MAPGLAQLSRDLGRKVTFLGDFIDRGPDQVRVLDVARRMVGEGVGANPYAAHGTAPGGTTRGGRRRGAHRRPEEPVAAHPLGHPARALRAPLGLRSGFLDGDGEGIA
jgi:hypothetical protein